MKKKYIFIALIAFVLSGCNELFVDENPSNTPAENFNLIWKSFDEHYCYFEEKGVDWNAMKQKYSPQIKGNMSDEQLFAVCAQMLGELKDGHVNIAAPFNISRYWDWYQDYPQNFNYPVIERNYLGKDYVMASGMDANIIKDKNGVKYGYIYYSSFESSLSDAGMQSLMYKFWNCRGIILDIRDNGGGLVSNMFQLASYFASTEMQVGYTRYKKGKAHNDFTGYYAEKVTPSDVASFKEMPVVLLTNRSSYSAANIFTGIMKQFPNVVVMGDQTGGGSASPMSVNLPNGWIVRLSSICFTDNNKQTFEFGVAPDIYKSTTETDAANGKDMIIDAAMDYLSQISFN